MNQLTLSLTCIGLALACGDQGALDVGDVGKSGQALSDYAANWDGYAEAFAFPGDGDDRVRLTLDESGAGVLRVGEEALFPPAADPNGFYPPTFGSTQDPARGGPPASLQGLRSGFEFAVSGASVGDARLQFQVDLGQVMDSWCALQAAEPVPGFSCGGSYGFSYGADIGCHTGNEISREIDCDIAMQCSACQCDTASCRGVRRERDPVEVDAALTDGGNTLEGTLVTSNHERVTIRMVR